MKRLAYLDWTRGLAVLVMIQCHAFNSFARMDLREGGPFVLSQFVGGMAAVLFLFLAGITFAFQLDSLEKKEAAAGARILGALRRAGYIMLIAYLFRLSNSLFSLPHPYWKALLKVDILNCMGLAMIVFSLAALCPAAARARIGVLGGLAIAVASPLMSQIEWGATPQLVRDYLTPDRSRFAFFPWGAYLAFGIGAGTIIRRTSAERLDRSMQWAVLIGFGLIFGGQYFSNIPYSLYRKSEFWLNSPALVLIRVGLVLLALAAAFLWTEYLAGQGWSWMQTLGKTSLMVYWVHIILVYGWLVESWKAALSIPQTAAATLLVIVLMVGLSVLRLRWKGRTLRPFARLATATR